MSAIADTDKLFFERADAALDQATAAHIIDQALHGSDDGELFLEYRESEFISLDDGNIRSAGFDSGMGFGLRAVAGEATGYAHSGEISEDALRRAAATVSAITKGHAGVSAEPPRATNTRLYSDANPLRQMEFSARTSLLGEIDAYARGKDARVKQVMASISGEWQAVQIMPSRWHPSCRPAPVGTFERLAGSGAGRPARNRQLRDRRAVFLRFCHAGKHVARRC